GVDGGELAGPGVPANREEVAADPAAFRLDDAEDGVGGDGRIDGAAAAREDLGAGLRGKGLAGGHDAAIGNDHRARLGAVLRPGGGGEEKEGGEGSPHGVHGSSVVKREAGSWTRRRGGAEKNSGIGFLCVSASPRQELSRGGGVV